MANNFDSNFTRQLARVFLEKFETNRVHSKMVNTQLLKGKFNPSTGDIVDFKRPTDYKSKRTPTGDISTGTRSPILTGKASGIVQDYFTVDVDFDEADEAIKMDQLDELLAPMATRIVTDMELDFAEYMAKNAALIAGTPGNLVGSWDDIANAGALMTATGIPMDSEWCYTINPYTQRKLASDQRSLGAGGSAGNMISESIRKATITEAFAGFDRVMSATTLPTIQTAAGPDLEGTLSAAPDPTYLAAKDTMRQTLPVTGFQAGLEVKAGQTVEIAGINMLNLSTRKPQIDADGNLVPFRATVVEDVTLAGGAGNILITGPAIFEANGAYNTVTAAAASGAVVKILEPVSKLIQPNLFWHKQAFSIGSVPIKKLYSTDTIATTEDGLQIRVSKYADGDANKQIVRFDFRPAYATLNPFFAGKGFGPASP